MPVHLIPEVAQDQIDRDIPLVSVKSFTAISCWILVESPVKHSHISGEFMSKNHETINGGQELSEP